MLFYWKKNKTFDTESQEKPFKTFTKPVCKHRLLATMRLLLLWFRLRAAKCFVNTESLNAGGSVQTFTDTTVSKGSPVHVCTVSSPVFAPTHHHQQVINASASASTGALSLSCYIAIATLLCQLRAPPAKAFHRDESRTKKNDSPTMLDTPISGFKKHVLYYEND